MPGHNATVLYDIAIQNTNHSLPLFIKSRTLAGTFAVLCIIGEITL